MQLVKSKIDSCNNQSQTDMTRLQSLVDRRDQSFTSATELMTNVQYALDKEDNYLQQDLVSLQSYFSKRDQALSMAASLVKKVNNTMTSGIRAIN